MVVSITEISVLILAVVAAVLLYKVLKTATSLAVNAVLGVFTLIVAKFLLGLEIAITSIAVLVCAIGGVFGALVIIVVNYLKLGFA